MQMGLCRTSVGRHDTDTGNRNTADRLKIYKTSPELYDAMMVLSNAAAKDIDPNSAS